MPMPIFFLARDMKKLFSGATGHAAIRVACHMLR
jgi:hypothetical protein